MMPERSQNRLSETPPSAIVSLEIAALQRRRALLSGLGKGAAATAALAPLISQAGGTHKIPNTALPGNFGYCSVSGFQSAAISGSPAPTVCSAFAPRHYLLTPDALVYSTLTSPSAVNASRLATALNNKYFSGVSPAPISNSMVNNSLLATPLSKLIVPNRNLLVLPLTSNTGTALGGTNFPDTFNPLGLFHSIFLASTDQRTLLEVLYDGVLSASPSTANCYFLAAYLTVYNSTPSTLPTGLDKPYVIAQYIDNAGPLTNAYKFFQALCVTP